MTASKEATATSGEVASDKAHKLSQSGAFKLVGALGVVLPIIVSLISVVSTYVASSQQKMDDNFRQISTMLTSDKIETRLAAATNMGTFIQSGILGKDNYYDSAVDMLVNSVSSELNYRVLGAIRGSLEKVDPEDYLPVIDKLLKLDRNTFAFQYPYENWRDSTRDKKNQLAAQLDKYKAANLLPSQVSEVDKLKNRYNYDLDQLDEIERELTRINTHRSLFSNFFTSFLFVTRNNPIPHIKFFQNSIYNSNFSAVQMPYPSFNRSTIYNSNVFDSDFSGATITDVFISYSSISNTNFNNSTIDSTYFKYSNVFDSDFSGSAFSNVYFYGSDLRGSNFTGVSGIDPHYFYGANISKARFDEATKRRLDMEIKTITPASFKQYIAASELSESKYKELLTMVNRNNK